MNTRNVLTGILAGFLLLAATPTRAAVIVTISGEPSWSWDEPQQTERFSKTVPLAKGGSIMLTNIAGDIVVTGGSGDQVVIDAVKRGRTAEDLKSVEIQIVSTEGRVEINTKYPRQQLHAHRSPLGHGWRQDRVG